MAYRTIGHHGTTRANGHSILSSKFEISRKLDMIRQYYNGISDNEFKDRLIKAGFEIVEGIPGQLLLDEPDDGYILCQNYMEPDFVIPARTIEKKVQPE